MVRQSTIDKLHDMRLSAMALSHDSLIYALLIPFPRNKTLGIEPNGISGKLLYIISQRFL